MRHFSDAYAALRRKNRGQYALLAGCSFFSVLLITAYVCMMRSPTILSVLPEGGDSRKQVMMVFVLAVIGCAVFTAYAAGLFFRQRLYAFICVGHNKAVAVFVHCVNGVIIIRFRIQPRIRKGERVQIAFHFDRRFRILRVALDAVDFISRRHKIVRIHIP